MTCGGDWLNMELIPNGIAHIVFDHVNASFDQNFYVKASNQNDFENNLELIEKINHYKSVFIHPYFLKINHSRIIELPTIN